METALLLLQAFNAAAPRIAEIILLIKKTDGTIAIIPFLDQADPKYQDNLKQIAEWYQAHPK